MAGHIHPSLISHRYRTWVTSQIEWVMSGPSGDPKSLKRWRRMVSRGDRSGKVRSVTE